jgi:maleate cis-trans isomerase
VDATLDIAAMREVPAVDAERLSAFIATLDTQRCDAIVLLATDLPTFGCLAELEAKFRLPILTSNQTLLWSALRVLKQRPAKPLGRLFER